MTFQIVKNIVRHKNSATEAGKGTIIGIELAGRELLLTAGGKSRYDAAMLPTSAAAVAFEACNEPMDVPAESAGKFAGKDGMPLIRTLTPDGEKVVRSFLKVIDSTYTL